MTDWIPEEEEYTEDDRWYECWSCGWVGKTCVKQICDLFNGDDEVFMCPTCGDLIDI